MAYNEDDDVVYKGSGRSRLPSRLRKGSPVEVPIFTTVDREALELDDDVAALVYDSDLEAVVLWNGTEWTNVDGSALA